MDRSKLGTLTIRARPPRSGDATGASPVSLYAEVAQRDPGGTEWTRIAEAQVTDSTVSPIRRSRLGALGDDVRDRSAPSAFTFGGSFGPIVLGLTLTAWAMRLDVRVGWLFGLMQAAYAWTTVAIVHALLPTSPAATLGFALVAIIAAIMTEVASHRVLQGYGPKPPVRALEGLPRHHKLAFVPYFVVTFGLFFLTLDLSMRLFSHRSDLNRRVNAIATTWHEDAVSTAVSGEESRELQLHRRAIAELS